MTKGCKILSIELPEAVLHQLTSEAQAPPFLGNRSKYARGILEQRHEKTIIISPQAQAQADHYEQQLAQLAQDHQRQLDQQAQAHQQQLDQQAKYQQQQLDRLQLRLEERDQTLAQLQQDLRHQQQAYNELQEEHDAIYVDHGRTQFRQEMVEQKLAERTEEFDALTKQHQELQQQFKALQKKARSAQEWVGVANNVTNLLDKHSDLVQEGLGKFFNGMSQPEPTRPAQPHPEPSYATQLGQSLIKSFPGAALKDVNDFISYLYDTPSAKDQLFAQPEFTAYQKLRRTKEAGGKGKPQ